MFEIRFAPWVEAPVDPEVAAANRRARTDPRLPRHVTATDQAAAADRRRDAQPDVAPRPAHTHPHRPVREDESGESMPPEPDPERVRAILEAVAADGFPAAWRPEFQRRVGVGQPAADARASVVGRMARGERPAP